MMEVDLQVLLCLFNLFPVALHLTLKLADQPGINKTENPSKDVRDKMKMTPIVQKVQSCDQTDVGD